MSKSCLTTNKMIFWQLKVLGKQRKKKQCCWEKDPLFSGQSHGDHPMKTYVLIRGTSDVEAVKNVMFGENGNLM